MAALAAGIEIQCRLSNVLLLAPAEANLGLYITGITGPAGAAAGLGRAMGFDTQHMTWAIGLGAAQGCGFRATHGSMAGHVVPALAARGGVWAALLAAQGFTVEAHLCMGDPATELVRAAEEQHADLLAMATHGHRGVQDLVHGATADRVRHRVKIPVLMLQAQ